MPTNNSNPKHIYNIYFDSTGEERRQSLHDYINNGPLTDSRTGAELEAWETVDFGEELPDWDEK